MIGDLSPLPLQLHAAVPEGGLPTVLAKGYFTEEWGFFASPFLLNVAEQCL